MIRLVYSVHEHGWATCDVTIGDSAASMLASYAHDSLAELCVEVASVANGANSGRVVFMDEPGEHHLCLERIDPKHVQVSVLWHTENVRFKRRTPDGQLVMQGITTIAHLRGQAFSAVKDVLNGLGTEAYRDRWRHNFPIDAYNRLRDAG
jgi:hypothetical protein